MDGFLSGLKTATSALTTFGKDVGQLASRVTNFGKQLGSALLAPARAVTSLVEKLFTLKAIFAALIAGKAFQALVTGPAQAAVELERMAARAGLAADQLERLQFVVGAAGGRSDDVSIGLEKLNRILDDTRRGSEDFVPILKELGLLGLSIDQVVDRVLTNPNLGAGGLKKLGISELAVLSKLSREEIDQLLVSFTKLGNGTDAELFKIGNRFQKVKTQLAEGFGNIFESVSKLIMPPLLDGLEVIEKFLEDHMPEILAFFDTVGQQVANLFAAIKKTSQTPLEFTKALQKSVDATFLAIGDSVKEIFKGIVRIGIKSVTAIFDGTLLLLGPFFKQLFEGVKIELDVLIEKADNIVGDWIEDLFQWIKKQYFELQRWVAKQLGEFVDGLINTLAGDSLLGFMVDGLREVKTDLLSVQSEAVKSQEALAKAAKATADERKRRDESLDIDRTGRLEALVTKLDAESDKQSNDQLNKFTTGVGAIVSETTSAMTKIRDVAFTAAKEILDAFGFSTAGVAVDHAANLAKRRAELEKQLQGQTGKAGPVQGPALPPDFIDTTSPQALQALSTQLEANDKAAREERERQLALAEQKLDTVIGRAFDGIHSAFDQIFIEGVSTMEALGSVARKISNEFIGDTMKKLQDGLSKGLAAAFDDPKVGGAIGDLAGALLGIAATVFSIFQSKKSSKKSFGNVEDIVNSSEAIRGIVAGPESVAIATVGENIKEAFIPTENLLSRILRAIERGGGGGASGGDFEFVTIPTS